MAMQRSIRRVLVLVLAAGVLMVGSVQSGLADSNLPNIPAHRHFVDTPNGDPVEVGPRLCDDSSLQGASNQFHSNVHGHVAGSQGPGTSAPGLHNGKGAEITATDC